MRRQKQHAVDSMVYAYGCGRPLSGVEHAYAEQARNRALWDRLVDIDRAHDVALLAAASADDERLIVLRDEIYHAGRALVDAIDSRARERKRLRGKTVPQAFDEAVSAASARHKTARTEFFARLKDWRKANPLAMVEFSGRRFSAIAQARNTSGLYWGNYNRVIQSFDAARTLCMKSGRRLRRSDEDRADGCLTVQIQRTSSGLGAAPEELQNGTFAPLQIGRVPDSAYDRAVPRGERARQCRVIMQMRADRDGNMLTLPVWMHRPLPEGSRVKSAQITWRDGGARNRKWQLALTIVRPRRAEKHTAATAAVGIDVGWRVRPDGSLRVAYWHADDGDHGEFALPAPWMEHMDWAERTQSEIDADIIHGEQAIRRAHLRLKGGRSKAIGARRESYRLFARRIAMRYGVVGVEKLDLARLVIKDDDAEYAGRAQRQRAAVYSLLLELRHQCAKHGARIVDLVGPSTMQCHACGRVGEPTDRAALMWTCDGCGTAWDQDHNAAINLMRAAAIVASGEVVRDAESKKNNVLAASPGARIRAARKLPAEIAGINEL